MANTKKEEARALDNEERDLVEKSHHPALQDLSDQDLSQLVKLTRERRDKAKTQANQRRREMRGKAAPKGATPSKSDEGSKAKLAVLAMAVSPRFDPNAVAGLAPDRWRNRALTDTYEPGSTMKSVIAAAALEEKVMTPGSMIYGEHGQFSIALREQLVALLQLPE